ncbi:hypothetical protein VL06_16250 [Rossellomorea marisflavi]|nr:hypothetical protein VL06_16250 [Rossellomorea marisflavi]
MMTKIFVMISFIDARPENRVKSKTRVMMTIIKIGIYSGLNLGAFCKSISLSFSGLYLLIFNRINMEKVVE